MLDEIRKQAEDAVEEFLEKSKVKAGDVVVVGCSSSEIGGDNIGSNSNPEVAQTVFEAIYSKLNLKRRWRTVLLPRPLLQRWKKGR